MDKYRVKITPRAASDLDEIYSYLADVLKNIGAAEKYADSITEAILSLDTMPKRGAERTVGAFANKGYRQLLVKNYIIVYRIDEENRKVIVVTVRYSRSSF